MGGTSGVLTRVFLMAAGDAYEAGVASGEAGWRRSFVAGTKAVMDEGGAAVGDRTLVDALKPAADVLTSGSGSVGEAAHAARVGMESTKTMMKARFGRSSHVRGEKLMNQPDPGALAVCIILDAIADLD